MLASLILSNVIANETLSIVLDRLLGGGSEWPAVLESTVLVGKPRYQLNYISDFDGQSSLQSSSARVCLNLSVPLIA